MNIKQHKFQLITPVVGDKIYQTNSFNKGIKKCYNELKSYGSNKYDKFSVIDLTTYKTYEFALNKNKKNIQVGGENENIKENDKENDKIVLLEENIKILEEKINKLEEIITKFIKNDNDKNSIDENDNKGNNDNKNNNTTENENVTNDTEKIKKNNKNVYGANLERLKLLKKFENETNDNCTVM